MSTATNSPFHGSTHSSPSPSSMDFSYGMMAMVGGSPLRHVGQVVQKSEQQEQQQVLAAAQTLINDDRFLLQLDRQQKEAYKRRLVVVGRAENIAIGRVLGSTSTTTTASLARNKQKRTLSQIIGGISSIKSCPQLEAYLKASLGSGLGEQPAFTRAFPGTPERVLDAPGLVDDFYLNVLDWGKRNVLGVALGPSVYLWNGRTGAVSELLSMPNEANNVTSLRWIHDGSSIAVGNSEGHLQIWDAEAGKKIRTIIASPEGHRLASIAWNKHLLSSGSRNGQVQTFDVRLPRPLILSHQSHHEGTEVCGLEWSPDGQQLASGGNNNMVHVWDINCPAPRHIFTEHCSAVKAIAWCPWKQGLLATGGGSQDKHIRTWNTVTGDLISSMNTDSSVSSLVWSKTSRELVSAHGQPSNQIRVWKVTSTSQSACQLIKSTGLEQAHSARILHMTLSPDGQSLVTAGADESIKFWRAFEPATGKEAGSGPGKKKPGSSSGGNDGKDYVLMPKFSRSGAISRAMNSGNRMVM